MLEKMGRGAPGKVFVKRSKTEQVTYRQMRELTISTAAGLHRLGVRHGQRHCLDAEYRRLHASLVRDQLVGRNLRPDQHGLQGQSTETRSPKCRGQVIVAHASLAPLLSQVDTANIATVVITGGDVIIINDLEEAGQPSSRSGRSRK
jgi:hypothetical protein